MTEQVFRIFVSSPGDVPDERRRVDLVVERLNTEFRGRARLETVRWETSYYSAHDTFQKQIPEAAQCDLVIAIFRARLGTPLPASFPTLPSGEPYPSGTAYEVLSAIEVRRGGQRVPDVYVFRYPHAPAVALDAPDRAEVEAQWGRLRGFFDRWFRTVGGEFLAAFQDYGSTDDFARRVEDCLRQWLATRGILAQGPVWDRVLKGSPFPGLAAFGPERGGVFFGRDLAIARIVERLQEVEAAPGTRLPFLLILGASGAGKSSLLRAGLLPRLALPGTIPEIDLWRVAVVALGPDPFLSLAEALFADAALGPELREGTFRTRELLAKQLAGDPDLAAAPLRDALARAAERRRAEAGFDAPRPARLALAIDQAERLFTEAEPARAAAFSGLLAVLVRARLASVILALRSDAYARLQADEALVALRTAGAAFDLLPPNAAELEEMVSRPVAACHPPLAFETRDGRSLAARLVEDARGGDALPLLQMTLSRLYAAEAGRGDGLLRFADYRGMDAAVTETADEALAALPEDARAELPALVTGLVADVWTDPATGAAVPAVVGLDRAAFEARRPARAALVAAFVERRLLTAEGDGALERVRPVHEALLRVWPRAVAIVGEVGHLVRVRHTLEPIVRAWAEAPDGEKARHLEISPALLGGAQDLVGRFDADVPGAMRSFIAAAGAAAEARRQEERAAQERRIRDAEALAAANRRIARRTGAGLAAALLLAGLAGWQWRVAQHETVEAEAQRDRAEHTLALATRTANGLVFDLAEKFKDAVGVPAATVEDIIDRARQLQDQLLGSGESSTDLRLSQAQALQAASETLMTLGRSEAALAAGQKAQALFDDVARLLPNRDDVRRAAATARQDVGEALAAQGHLPEALAAYRASLETLERLAGAKPDDLSRQRDVAVAQNKIGNVLQDQGDLDGALAAYRASLAIAERLAAADPANAVWQDDLAFSHQEVGDALDAKHRYGEAQASYAAALDVARRLAEAAPGDTARQRGLEIAYLKVGDAAQDQGRRAEALDAYRSARDVADRLARSDPTNARWQRDLAVAHERVGNILRTLNRLPEALAAYRASLDASDRLARLDPRNVEWQRDLAIAQENVGAVLADQRDWPAALKADRDALTIRQSIARSDPGNAAWQLDLAQASDRVAEVDAASGQRTEALSAYRTSLGIVRALVASDPNRADWQHRLAADDIYVGQILDETGDLEGALASFRNGLEVGQRIAALAPEDPDGPDDIASAYTGIGGVLERQHDAKAIDAYRAALVVRRRQADTHPADDRLRAKVAATANILGSLELLAGQPDAALPDLRVALDARERLARADPNDPDRQLKVAEVQTTIGDALARTDDAPAALAADEAGLTILRKLEASSTASAEVEDEVAAAEDAVGDLSTRQQDGAKALDAYRAALEARDRLAAAAPDDAGAQRDLAQADQKLGDALRDQGKAAEALPFYRARVAILRHLAAGKPNDGRSAFDLAAASAQLSDLLRDANDLPGALDAEQVALDAMAAMAKADPGNPKWQKFLAIAQTGVGEIEAAQGRDADALVLYRASLATREALARAAPDDGELQRQISALHKDIGDDLMASDAAAALGSYAAALSIARDLVRTDADNAAWQRELSVSYAKLGFADQALGKVVEAREAYGQGRAIAAAMAAKYPDQPQFKDDVAMFDGALGALPK